MLTAPSYTICHSPTLFPVTSPEPQAPGPYTSDFKPAWWLPNPHAQTLWPYLFRRRIPLNLTRERLELPDGDFIDLCWTGAGNGPIVTVIHGLEGAIDSHYAKGIMAAIAKAGWRGLFMHFRGCSGVPNRLPRSYHSGDTGDIAFLFQTIRERYPRTPLAAVGYSLGGNALLKYLGEDDREKPLNAAVAVSVPYDLANGANRLDRGLSRLYQRHLIGRLHHRIRTKYRNRAAPIPLERLKTLTNFWTFDDQITAPLHGFKDVHDYYHRASSRQFLQNIKLPTLLLHAADDPFMTPAAIPKPAELSRQVKLELSKNGGHVGFIGGSLPWRPEYWLEKRIPEYLRDHLQ